MTSYTNNYYMVSYGKLKEEVVVLLVVESSSVVVGESGLLLPMPAPPMRSIPAGLCQDTWYHRLSDREWDCSHSPSKVSQLVPVLSPPHAVKEDRV